MNALLLSIKNAFSGICTLFLSGRNAKIQLLAAISIIIAGIVLRFNYTEWLAVIVCIFVVLSLEAINTSIELMADEITTEQRQSIRNIKDTAAGAVLIAAIGSIAITCVVLSNHLSKFF